MFKKIKSALLENRGTRQTVTKNIFWLTVSQIGSRLIRAWIIIYAARVLGTGEFGVFSYALGLAAFFTIFADIGVNAIITRDIAQKPDEAKRYISAAFWIKLALLIFSSLAVIIIAPTFSKIDGAEALLPFIALLVIFDNLREFSNALFRAREKMEYEAATSLILNISITAIGFLILSYYQTAYAITAAYISSAGIGMIFGFFFLKQDFKSFFNRPQYEYIKLIFKSALPIALISLLSVFMANVDVIMLGWLKSADDVGLYSAAQKVIQMLYTIPAIFASSVFPLFSKLVGKKEFDKMREIKEKAITLSLGMALPIALGGIILASPIMDLLYGASYTPGAIAFQILLFTVITQFLSVFLGNLVLVYNQQNKLSLIFGAAGICNIILNYLLIPEFGIAGAAAATAIVQVPLVIRMWQIVKNVQPFYIYPHAKKIILASLGMAAFCFIIQYIFNIPVIISIILSAIVYYGLLILMKEKLLEEPKIILRRLTQ